MADWFAFADDDLTAAKICAKNYLSENYKSEKFSAYDVKKNLGKIFSKK